MNTFRYDELALCFFSYFIAGDRICYLSGRAGILSRNHARCCVYYTGRSFTRICNDRSTNSVRNFLIRCSRCENKHSWIVIISRASCYSTLTLYVCHRISLSGYSWHDESRVGGGIHYSLLCLESEMRYSYPICGTSGFCDRYY